MSLKDKITTYSKGANGRAVLVLHGFGSNPEEVSLIADYFKKKNFTVSQPFLLGHDDYSKIGDYSPKDWLEQGRREVRKLLDDAEKIFIIGVSFGGDLALSLAAEFKEKIKGVVTLEAPIFFRKKYSFLLSFVQPFFQLLGVKIVRKRRWWHRKNYQPELDKCPFFPVRAMGRLYRYMSNEVRHEICSIVSPVFAVQAADSDLINPRSAKYIIDNVRSEKKEVYYLDTDNHDLNLLDEKGKILMLEKIYRFIIGI